MKRTNLGLRVGALLAAAATTAIAADWPCEGGNPGRTGHAPDALAFPMGVAWSWQAPNPPSPAFADTTVRRGEKLNPRYRQGYTEPSTHDFAYHPVVAGGRVFLGSSSDEDVVCLDAASGKVLWTFATEGAIRFAPWVDGDRAIVASDDGCVYALGAADGARRWSARVAPEVLHVMGNGRPISAWPVRGGPAVADGLVYCAAGVFPEQGEYVAILKADSGEVVKRQAIPYAVDGQLLLDGGTIWAPTHRTAPARLHRADGTPFVAKPPILLSRGAAEMWTIDGRVAWGPDESGHIYLRLDAEDVGTREAKPRGGVRAGGGNDDQNQDAEPAARPARGGKSDLGTLTLFSAWAALATPDRFFLVRDGDVLALDIARFRAALADRLDAIRSGREPANEVPAFSKLMGFMGADDAALMKRFEGDAAWTAKTAPADAFRCAIAAPNALVLGGDGRVVALGAADGKPVWTAEVEGGVRSLAAAGGTLYASTDTGRLYAFRSGAAEAAAPPAPAARPPFAADAICAEAATTALAQAGRSKGVCLVLGGGDGQLAAEIARRSEMFVVVFERDAAKAAAQRKNLATAGVHGRRVVVRHEPGAPPPAWPLGFANLVVSDEALSTGRVPYPARDILNFVQPYGGTIVFGARQGAVAASDWAGPEFSPWTEAPGASGARWAACRRGPLSGAGEWPNENGDLANTMNSGETRVPGDAGALQLQWFGAPYAGDVVDRHAVPQPPLTRNGILFLAGKTNTLTAVDAYNGTILWKVVVPDTLRMLASHNASPFACAADGRHVFGATGAECWMLDARTGAKAKTFGGVAAGCDWGFIADAGGALLGTSQGKAANEAARAGLKLQVAATGEAVWSSKASTSLDLFAIDPRTGQKAWTYKGGLILNPTIAVGGGRVFFAESRNRAAMAGQTGLMTVADWIARDGDGAGAQIVALSLATGRSVWTKPVARDVDQPGQWLMFLTVAGDRLLATRTYFKREGSEERRGYDFEAFDAATGESCWTQWLGAEYTGRAFGLAYGKNSLAQRLVIVGGTFYLHSNLLRNANADVSAFDLATGKSVFAPMPVGIHHAGCSVAIGSLSALYYRDWVHVAFDLATRTSAPLTGVTRPSCWPNTLPAAGLVLAPEGSAYCSCGLSYQMSFALAPKSGAAGAATREGATP